MSGSEKDQKSAIAEKTRAEIELKKPARNSRPQLIALFVTILAVIIAYLREAPLEFDVHATRMKVGGSRIKGFSPTLLLAFRLLAFDIVAGVTGVSLLDPDGLTIETKYLPESSLRSKTIILKGAKKLSTFTVWSWILIGVYFMFASCASLLALSEPSDASLTEKCLLNATLVLFEVAFSVAYLVTAVVTFVLIPMRENGGKGDASSFWKPIPLVMHNGNVALMLADAMLNNMQVRASHWPFCLLWGLAYVLFAWKWQGLKGLYYYPFLDHTLSSAKALGFHLALMAVLLCFHALGVAVTSLGGSVPLASRALVLFGATALMTNLGPRQVEV